MKNPAAIIAGGMQAPLALDKHLKTKVKIIF